MTTTLKTCTKCGVEKSVEYFYVKDKATNRLSGNCKACHINYVRAYRVSHIEIFRAMDRRRGMLPHRVSARDKWKTKYPERARARYIVGNAIKNGDLIRLPCHICGNEKSQAHHEDYDYPLVVMWLCDQHHKDRHKQLRKKI